MDAESSNSLEQEFIEQIDDNQHLFINENVQQIIENYENFLNGKNNRSYIYFYYLKSLSFLRRQESQNNRSKNNKIPAFVGMTVRMKAGMTKQKK